MTTIGSGMFSGCESLRSITLPEGITEIGESAFAGCSSLTELTIPDSVTAIRKGAFDNIEVRSHWLSPIPLPRLNVRSVYAASSNTFIYRML